MRRELLAAVAMAANAIISCPTQAEEVRLTLQPDQVVNRIDEKVYGQFLEHIYHSVNGGLWGELIWNRSFEQNSAGRWSTRDGSVVQASMAADQRLVFGDPDWTDYEFTLEALKTGGNEGFLVLTRVRSEKAFYWCNLGGWGNQGHQLERGRDDGQRWHTVGPRAEGQIETGQWYRIRVRCEGPRLQVWLDDKLLIDFTDPDGHPRGAVGVGTWSTQAEFRNLKVTALDGKELFSGLPPTLTRPTVAKHWQLIGSGEAYVESDDALNSEYSQRLTGKGELGLEQGALRLEAGETYEGSLWCCGKAPGGLLVRLVDGETVLAQQKLAAPTQDWQQRSYSLRASAGADEGAIQIVAPEGGDVKLDQVSLMPKSWAEAGGFRPDLLEAVAKLRAPVIRWPGGCFASAYRWKDGIGPQHTRKVYPREIWDDLDVNSYGTDEFIAMCRRVGTEPLIVVNIGTKNWNGDVQREAFLEEVAAWIEYCNGPANSKWGRIRAENGHPEPYAVKYWEIDNETWHMGAEAYADAVCEFAPMMRRVDPTIKLAACGSAGYGDGRNGSTWNQTIIDRCADLVDYLSIHHYENPDNFDQGPRQYEAFFEKTAGQIAASKNPNLKIYVSEWNAQSTDWRTGLYCGGLLNAFERCGQSLEIGGPALFLRHTSATAWDNAFINFDEQGWFPAPNYVVMKLWRDHYAAERIAIDGRTGPLNAVATRAPDGKSVCLKVVNPTKDAVVLQLELAGGKKPASAECRIVAPGSLSARNTLESPDTIRPKTVRRQISGTTVKVELPALSAGVVTVGLD